MATAVIMPALEMAQDSGKVVRWLKFPGDAVAKGEPLLEIETDKVAVEIEAAASGILQNVTAREGDVVPVGQTIALIVAAGEAWPDGPAVVSAPRPSEAVPPPGAAVKTFPLATRIAEQHGVAIDALTHVASQKPSSAVGTTARLAAASPKARRLAAERGVDIGILLGSGPGGAVLATDVPSASSAAPTEDRAVGTVWRIMAERMTASWTTAPHFYLFREVNVSRLISWREQANTRSGTRVTYTDLLVKLVAAALSRHPGVNASWRDGGIVRSAEINIGLAVAIEDGLVVPVIHRADTLSLPEIAAYRESVVDRGQTGKLRPVDIQGGAFTISNLGAYRVDAFQAILNPPQAAILAVGRIADRVVAVNGQPAVRPTMMLTLSCDHRVLDGVHGALFLGTLAELIEEPLALVDHPR